MTTIELVMHVDGERWELTELGGIYWLRVNGDVVGWSSASALALMQHACARLAA